MAAVMARFDMVVDLYFISDMFVSFRTAYYNKKGLLKFKPDRIARNYFKGRSKPWAPLSICCPPPLPTLTLTGVHSRLNTTTLHGQVVHDRFRVMPAVQLRVAVHHRS